MSIIHRFRSSTVALSVCALLTCALACTPGAAAARSGADKAAALAQERYYSSYGRPHSADARILAALAQERYYSSYGQAEPMTLPASPVAADDQSPLPIVLAVAAMLVVVAAGGSRLHRIRSRRRSTALAA